MLTPVPFTKGRQREPRLSPIPVPGRHSSRYWADAEMAVLREHYETRGPGHCALLLPTKSLNQIYAQANKLALRAPKAGSRRQPIGKTYDEAIQLAWPTLKGRGAVQRLADELNIKRAALSQRAVALGLTMPHRKDPPWTPAEEQLLRRAPVNNPDLAVKFFAAHGFTRSPAAIMVRCKRMGVSRRLQDVLSATAAAKIVGVDSKTVGSWCGAGDIPATRRGTQRLSQQGGDMWSIQPSELRRWVLDNIDRIDIRRVDKHAFVALISGETL